MRILEPLVIGNDEMMSSLKAPPRLMDIYNSIHPPSEEITDERARVMQDLRQENLHRPQNLIANPWSIPDKLSQVFKTFHRRMKSGIHVEAASLDSLEQAHIKQMFLVFNRIKGNVYYRQQIKLLSQSFSIPELALASAKISSRKKKGEKNGKKTDGSSPQRQPATDEIFRLISLDDTASSSKSTDLSGPDTPPLSSPGGYIDEQSADATAQKKEEAIAELTVGQKEPARATEKQPRKVVKPAAPGSTSYRVSGFSDGDLCSNLRSLSGSRRAIHVNSAYPNTPIVLSGDNAKTLCTIFSKLPGQINWQDVVATFRGCKGKAEHKFSSVWIFYGPTGKKRLDQPHGGGEIKLRRTVHFIKKAFEELLDIDVSARKWKVMTLVG